MPGTDDLEARVAALESQMQVIRADAAAARVLAGGADRDVSVFAVKLDAHTRTLNALRETQLEQGSAISSLNQRMSSLDQRMDSLDQQMDSLEREMRGGFAMTARGMAQITALLENIAGAQGDQPGSGPEENAGS